MFVRGADEVFPQDNGVVRVAHHIFSARTEEAVGVGGVVFIDWAGGMRDARRKWEDKQEL